MYQKVWLVAVQGADRVYVTTTEPDRVSLDASNKPFMIYELDIEFPGVEHNGPGRTISVDLAEVDDALSESEEPLGPYS